MRLENILGLTYGKLINDPFVSKFENTVLDPSKVKRGDLFITYDNADIKEAIFNGAYGIIFHKPTKILDYEIAWIKVTDLENTTKKLLRYRLISNNINAYECDEITFCISKQLSLESRFLRVEGDLNSIFSQLWFLEPNSYVLYAKELFSIDIFASIKYLKNDDKQIEIKNHTVFETTFLYKEKLYEKEQIPALFIPQFNSLVSLLNELNIIYKIKKFSFIEHFKPIFITKEFQKKDFGTTEQVLIFEKNINLLDEELEFLKKTAPWAKIICLTPYMYKDIAEIKNILRDKYFNFALIIGLDSKSLDETIFSEPKQLTLDF